MSEKKHRVSFVSPLFLYRRSLLLILSILPPRQSPRHHNPSALRRCAAILDFWRHYSPDDKFRTARLEFRSTPRHNTFSSHLTLINYYYASPLRSPRPPHICLSRKSIFPSSFRATLLRTIIERLLLPHSIKERQSDYTQAKKRRTYRPIRVWKFSKPNNNNKKTNFRKH